jgi:hypothetical protein
MPSFRFTAAVGRLRPGVSPARVLPELSADARTITIVEASSVDVRNGRALLTIRFTADDDTDALNTAEGIAGFADDLVELTEARLTRRDGARWNPIASRD